MWLRAALGVSDSTPAQLRLMARTKKNTLALTSKEQKEIEDHYKTISWVKENHILAPEDTADRGELAGQCKYYLRLHISIDVLAVELRAITVFSIWVHGAPTVLLPATPPKLLKKIIIRGEVASLNGPATFLVQGGIWNMARPMFDSRPMILDNIISINIDDSEHFRGG